MEPKVQRGEKKEEIEEKRDFHREFSRKMYEWIRRKRRKRVEMAIYLYVYTKEKRRSTMGLTSENYVDEAERVIKTLFERDRDGKVRINYKGFDYQFNNF